MSVQPPDAQNPAPPARSAIALPPSSLDLPGTLTRVVVFGGTFDPPHVQHTSGLLAHADAILGPAGLLVYVPAARSPFKVNGSVASNDDRVRLLRLALGGDPRTRVWTDEIDRAAAAPGEPSFMIDTLLRLRTLLDARSPAPELRLLIGTDQALAMQRWRAFREVMQLAPPLVWLRPPCADAETFAQGLRQSKSWNDGEIAAWIQAIAPLPLLDVSATQIREQLTRSREPLNDPLLRRALPIRVLEEIATRGIYRRE